MAIALTTIFGNEIKVSFQPRKIHRQFSAFPGADGVTAMHMGSRGYQVEIHGRIRAANRPSVQSAIAAIDAYRWYGVDNYTFAGCSYNYVVWQEFEIIKDNGGKAFHINHLGQVFCDFIMYGYALI